MLSKSFMLSATRLSFCYLRAVTAQLARKPPASARCCLALWLGFRLLVSVFESSYTRCMLFSLSLLYNRGEPIVRVPSVVVVDVAATIHVPHVIRIASVRRAQALVDYSLCPISLVIFRIFSHRRRATSLANLLLQCSA